MFICFFFFPLGTLVELVKYIVVVWITNKIVTDPLLFSSEEDLLIILFRVIIQILTITPMRLI